MVNLENVQNHHAKGLANLSFFLAGEGEAHVV